MLTQVLKHNAHSTLMDGLLAESLAYSTLQSGSGFQTWLAQQAHAPRAKDDHSTLLISRVAGQLQIQFNRPAYHNAYNEALKDALCEALQLAHLDDTITELTLSGTGPSFCAGGDLTEFGQADNPADAHISRTTRGAAALLGSLDIDTKAYVHGACIGAGIELPAFCKHITAHPDTFFQLPEVAMGLIPGAGGTVSVSNRIGRHNAALFALSNRRIDVTTALAWGLIDNVASEAGLDHASQ
jgi:enoyl-CoA hydratase/carnithine racemase